MLESLKYIYHKLSKSFECVRDMRPTSILIAAIHMLAQRSNRGHFTACRSGNVCLQTADAKFSTHPSYCVAQKRNVDSREA